MSKRKTAVGIAVLFALALSAFSVASASAANLTAVTCVTDPNGTFIGDHCLKSGSGNKAKHVEFNQDETTTGIATNANTASETTAARSSILTGTLTGVPTEITCTEVASEEGMFENRKNAKGEMYAHAEGKLHYKGCVVNKPAGKGCKVAGETVLTNQLTGTTDIAQEAEPALHTAEIKPKEGNIFTEIKIEKCTTEALNNTYPVTGTVKARLSGATVQGTGAEVTAQNTLKFGGQKAGLDGAITLHAHSNAGEETHPLTITTTS